MDGATKHISGEVTCWHISSCVFFVEVQREKGQESRRRRGGGLGEHVQLAAPGSSQGEVGIVHVQPSGHQCSSSVAGDEGF